MGSIVLKQVSFPFLIFTLNIWILAKDDLYLKITRSGYKWVSMPWQATKWLIYNNAVRFALKKGYKVIATFLAIHRRLYEGKIYEHTQSIDIEITDLTTVRDILKQETEKVPKEFLIPPTIIIILRGQVREGLQIPYDVLFQMWAHQFTVK